jgi:predicted dehydrogenase
MFSSEKIQGQKVRVGVVGTGFAGRAHISGYKASEHAVICAVCDVEDERAKATASEYDIPKSFNDYPKMLKLEELDAISICTPNKMHAPVAVAALEAGKHVLCEKPLARNAHEAAKMVEAANKSGKILAMPLQFRHQGKSLLLKRLIEDGELGEVYYSKTAILRKTSIPRGWFHVKELSGGGPVLDLASHMLDLAWWLMGKPKPRKAYGVTYNKLGQKGKGMGTWGVGYGESAFDVEDMAASLIKFEDGQTIFVEVSWTMHIPENIMYTDIFGTEGGASLYPEFRLYKEVFASLTDAEGLREGKKVETPSPWKDEDRIARFVQNIISGTEPLAPGSDGLQIMRMIDAIYESAETGQIVSIQ